MIKKEDKDIIIKNLSVSFDKETNLEVLKKATTKFESGKITAIIGESGCGKSVLAMSVLGLLSNKAKVQGEVKYKGKNLLELSKKEMNEVRKKEFGLIPQNPADALNAILKIGRQIGEVIVEQDKKKKESMIDKLLEKVGFANIEKIKKSYAFELSGGMQQRVVSLFGIGGEPEWIIADEPTKGLDSILRDQIYEFFLEIKGAGKRSMIIITHDISLAVKIADNLVVMKDGRIIEEGDAKEIYNKPEHEFTKILINSLPSRWNTQREWGVNYD